MSQKSEKSQDSKKLAENGLLQTRFVNRVADPEAPPFWENNLAMRLDFLELQQDFGGITDDETKFDNAVELIGAARSSRVADIIVNPPKQNKYETIKQRINEVDTHVQSELRRLHANMRLGDKKPSALLKEMMQSSDTPTSVRILKTLWLHRLPVEMQSHLMKDVETIEELVELAQSADKFVKDDGKQAAASAVSDSGVLQNVDELKVTNAHVNRSIPHTPVKWTMGPNGYCYYHDNFGYRAIKCSPPCTFWRAPSSRYFQSYGMRLSRPY